MLVFKDFMDEGTFIQWYSDYPQYIFDKGEGPLPEDFTSKQAYEDMMSKVALWKANNAGRAK